MEESAEAVIMVRRGAPPAPTPTKIFESHEVTTNNSTTERQRLSSSSSGSVNEGKAMVQTALDLLSVSRQEIQRLSRAVVERNATIDEQRQMIQVLNQHVKETGEGMKHLHNGLR
ncbi:hypothetical protein HRG_012151 [Hirsutella rhossiliensis]